VLMTLCGLWLIGASDALAAGGPVPPVLGGSGVSATSSPFNFIALAAGPDTLVERVRRVSGTVGDTALVHGSFGVPAVSYDGSSTGLSADGRTLVLAGAVGLTTPTQLVVLNTSPLGKRASIVLNGAYLVDAISPDGRWLYLIHYRSLNNISDYEVRAYDLVRGQLLPKPIVDPREPDEKMTGLPVTRTMSPDGRWAYTLYFRGGGAPFIHALDTAAGRAFCVDLPANLAGISNNDPFNLRLKLMSATALSILYYGKAVAAMDTRTFAVRTVKSGPQPAPPARHPAGPANQDGSWLWALGIGLLAALITAGSIVHRRRRSHIAVA